MRMQVIYGETKSTVHIFSLMTAVFSFGNKPLLPYKDKGEGAYGAAK